MDKYEHCKGTGWILLIVGILYLLTDLGAINWWPFSWYTVLFVLMGAKWAFAK